MNPELIDEGHRYLESYYELANMYVTIGSQSVTLSISDPQMKDRTAVGLCLIESLATLALEEGVDKEIISSVMWQCSRATGDLADRLSYLIVKEPSTDELKTNQ